MRKLKLQVQISIDGFIGGPNGEMDWMLFDWSDDLQQYVGALTDSADTILLGRKLAEGFIPHWKSIADNPETSADYARKFAYAPKVVFSRSLESSPWGDGARIAADVQGEVQALKAQDGGDLIAYGGAEFVSELVRHQLIDELYLFVNPAVLGKGLPIFAAVEATQRYRLLEARPFGCGIVVLVYQPANIG